jgi:hypothetical protein
MMFRAVFWVVLPCKIIRQYNPEDRSEHHLGESERRFISEGEKEHLVRRYPGNARSSF